MLILATHTAAYSPDAPRCNAHAHTPYLPTRLLG